MMCLLCEKEGALQGSMTYSESVSRCKAQCVCVVCVCVCVCMCVYVLDWWNIGGQLVLIQSEWLATVLG